LELAGGRRGCLSSIGTQDDHKKIKGRKACFERPRRNDFWDKAYESHDAKDKRWTDLKQLIDKRLESSLHPLHYVALILDHRQTGQHHMGELQQVFQTLWAMARVKSLEYVRERFGADSVIGSELASYIARSDQFSRIPFLKETASLLDLHRWWEAEQPSSSLTRLFRVVRALRSTTGRTEREWASLSRQTTPLRNRMSAATKRSLLLLYSNGPLLLTGKPHVVVEPKRKAPRHGSGGAAEQTDMGSSVDETSSSSSSSSSSDSVSDWILKNVHDLSHSFCCHFTLPKLYVFGREIGGGSHLEGIFLTQSEVWSGVSRFAGIAFLNHFWDESGAPESGYWFLGGLSARIEGIFLTQSEV
jgi:hypothetical protein